MNKITVCYSIYGNNTQENFSKVSKPFIKVSIDSTDSLSFEMDGLSAEKTVVAAEIYRYKGEWKIKFIGAGYNSGLEQLCKSYGVNVE